ncbi:MAG: hypothetical protein IJE84_06215, partial [Clostridia bacterium]|nr:hypothetical protein [Clostridia bacterium]
MIGIVSRVLWVHKCTLLSSIFAVRLRTAPGTCPVPPARFCRANITRKRTLAYGVASDRVYICAML